MIFVRHGENVCDTYGARFVFLSQVQVCVTRSSVCHAPVHKLKGRTQGVTVTSACHLHALPIEPSKLHAVIAIGVGHTHRLAQAALRNSTSAPEAPQSHAPSLGQDCSQVVVRSTGTPVNELQTHALDELHNLGTCEALGANIAWVRIARWLFESQYFVNLDLLYVQERCVDVSKFPESLPLDNAQSCCALLLMTPPTKMPKSKRADFTPNVSDACVFDQLLM